jgi:hypothetical protein
VRRFAALLLLVFAACSERETPPPPVPSLKLEADKGPVRVRVELTPESPRLSDHVELRLTVEADDGVGVGAPALEFEPFRVVDQSAEPMSIGEGGRRVFVTAATLEPQRSGELALGPFAVEFTVGDKTHTIETEAATMVVTSAVEAEARDLALLEPALEPVEIAPESSAPWWPWAVGAVLVALALLLLRRRRVLDEPVRVYTPTELAERELAALLADDPLARGEMQTFYSELTLIVRRYIERTTGVRAPEMTTQEFLRVNDSEGLRAFLVTADLVKFAGDRPDRAAIDESLARARRFVGLELEAAA